MRLAILALLLTGCVSLPRYEWYLDPNQGPMDYYRWQVVERDTMPYVCGFLPASEGACAVRLNQGLLQATDKPLGLHIPLPVEGREGRLCIVQGTMSAEDAKRLMAWGGEISLYEHELKHCNGWLHNLINGRVN